MPFTFKLAVRLALMKAPRVVVAAGGPCRVRPSGQALHGSHAAERGAGRHFLPPVTLNFYQARRSLAAWGLSVSLVDRCRIS